MMREIQGMSTIGFGNRECNLYKLTSRCAVKVEKGKCPGGVMNFVGEDDQLKNSIARCVGRGPLINIKA